MGQNKVYAVNQTVNVYADLISIELDSIEYLKGTDLYMYYYDDIINRYDIPNTIYDEFTKEEIEQVAKVVESETGNQDFISKVNVASVIFNRYKHCKFPDELLDIIYEPNQFAKPNNKFDQSTLLAVECAYIFGDTTNGALWFNTIGCDSWASKHREYIFTDEAGHEFYK